MTRPSDSSPSSQALLERARHTLQSLKYHEQAARYKAAAASLQAAMVHAENGEPAPLQHWLETESSAFQLGEDWREIPTSESILHASKSLRRIDIPCSDSADSDSADSDSSVSDSSVSDSFTAVEEPTQAAYSRVSPWLRMEQAAKARLATLGEDQDAPQLSQSLVEAEDSVADLGRSEVANGASVDSPIPEWIAAVDSKQQLAIPHRKAWWRAPHIWGSIVLHMVLIVCLGLIVVRVTSTPPLLAVVSAPFESDNVLLESPMEMASDLEDAPELEAMSTLAPFAVSELNTSSAIDGASLELERQVNPTAARSVSSTVMHEANESSKSGKVGSQMMAGAEFFGVKATGNTFVYVVDSSPSMRRGGAFEAARQEIVRSLRSMKPKQRYFISFFGKEIDPMILETGVTEKFPIYAKPENLDKTIDWLGRVQVQKEGLPPNNALTEAIAMQPDAIFLLFDGDTKVDVAKYLRHANRADDVINAGLPKVPIHVVHFYQDEFQAPMKRIAEENGGTYRFVPRPERSSKGNR